MQLVLFVAMACAGSAEVRAPAPVVEIYPCEGSASATIEVPAVARPGDPLRVTVWTQWNPEFTAFYGAEWTSEVYGTWEVADDLQFMDDGTLLLACYWVDWSESNGPVGFTRLQHKVVLW